MIYSSRTIARARPVLLAILVLGSLAFGSDAFARAWPKPEGYVSGRELREKTGAELTVVTLPDLGGEEVEPVAVDLFQAWGIGKKGTDEGVLILLASKERRVRIEVGYGLEGILPDGLCGSIIRRVMAPNLAAGRIGQGLLRGAAAVAGVIAKDRGVTITGAVAPEPEEEEGGRQGVFLAAMFVALIVSVISRMAFRRRGWTWTGRGWWDGPGPGGYGGMFGGFGGMGGGFGGGGGGGFGGFGGGRSGGGGASGGF